MDSTHLRFLALGDGFLIFPLVACTGRRRRGRRDRRFCGGRDCRFPTGRRVHDAAPSLNQGQRPDPSTPTAATSSHSLVHLLRAHGDATIHHWHRPQHHGGGELQRRR